MHGRLRPTDPADEPKSDDAPCALGARELVDVVVPRTSVSGRMRLVGRSEAMAITAETRRAFKTLGLIDEQGRVAGVAGDDWNAEIAVRYLAAAVRDPKDPGKPLATLEEWRECDDDQIESLWSEYRDMRERLDPLGDGNALMTDADVDIIRTAVKKKESALLMSFGSRKLATYLLTSAEEPAISPTPK